MMLSLLMAMPTTSQTSAGYIDPGIHGETSAFVDKVMQPYDGYAGDVIFVERNGTVHTNRPETQVLTAEPVEGVEGLYAWPGESERFPFSSPTRQNP